MSQTADQFHISRRGMSLVELIVAMAIFTIIMSGVMLMFTSVTNTVRRSYRTMDLVESTQGALMAIERDVQTTFSARAIGSDFHFYGEPNGFIFIGIGPDGNLGRLTYAVHVDTARLEEPHLPIHSQEPTQRISRGERLTLLRSRANMEGRFEDHPAEFSFYYPGTSDYVEVEVELVYGLLTRYFDSGVTNVSMFPVLDIFAAQETPPYLPPPNFPAFEDAYRADGLPWFVSDLLQFAGEGAGVSRNIWEKLETIEKCHYWLQLLNGPRIEPPNGWDHPLAIWRPTDVFDQFWYDHVPFRTTGVVAGGLEVYPDTDLFFGFPGPDGNPRDWRPFLWDHVVARDFVVYAWLLDSTGQRVQPLLNVVDITPVFRYNVESGATAGNSTPVFNSIFNLGADFDALSDPDDPDFDTALAALTAHRQFYELGNPLQSRLPSAFEITLTVISPPVSPSAPVDMYTFAQTVHIPTGFLRRNQAVN